MCLLDTYFFFEIHNITFLGAYNDFPQINENHLYLFLITTSH